MAVGFFERDFRDNSEAMTVNISNDNHRHLTVTSSTLLLALLYLLNKLSVFSRSFKILVGKQTEREMISLLKKVLNENHV